MQTLSDHARLKLEWGAGSTPRDRALEQLAGIYRGQGVLNVDGFGHALADRCHGRDACWGTRRDLAPHPRTCKSECANKDGENGSIFFPWVGPGYEPTRGVCIVAWNLRHGGNDWWPLTAEAVITARQLSAFEKNDKQWTRSNFAYRSNLAATAGLDALGRLEVRDRPAPTELMETLHRIARVQTVKCSPTGGRSTPFGEMNRSCPPRFLFAELDALKPRVLIALGGVARGAVVNYLMQHATEHAVVTSSPSFGRRQAAMSWGPMDVFGLWHPTYGGWFKSYDALRASLGSEPL